MAGSLAKKNPVPPAEAHLCPPDPSVKSAAGKAELSPTHPLSASDCSPSRLRKRPESLASARVSVELLQRRLSARVTAGSHFPKRTHETQTLASSLPVPLDLVDLQSQVLTFSFKDRFLLISSEP